MRARQLLHPHHRGLGAGHHPQPDGSPAHLANSVVRQAVEITNLRISEAINTIPAVAEAPFEPLRDAQWTAIEPLVERTRGAGGVASDLRKIVDGVRWVLQRGAKWREVPAQYGKATTCWRWYKCWSTDGTWAQVETKLGRPAALPKQRGAPKPIAAESSATTAA